MPVEAVYVTLHL